MASSPSFPISQAHHYITVKLTPKNFLHWKAQVEPFLLSQNLLGYVTGTVSPPSSLPPDSSPTSPLPAFVSTSSSIAPSPIPSSWEQQDALLRSFLISTLSDEVFPVIIGKATSKEIWDTLHGAYASPSTSRILSLRLALQELTHKPDEGVASFLHRAKALADELAAAGHCLTTADFNLHIFRALRSDFREVVPVLMGASSPLSFDDLLARLVSHEFLHGSQLKKLALADSHGATATASPPVVHATAYCQYRFFLFYYSLSFLPPQGCTSCALSL